MSTATRIKTKSTNGHTKAPPVLSRVVRPAKPHPLRWTHEQYHQMAERGYFEGKRVELIGGEIIQMAPMLSPHWAGVMLAHKILQQIFNDDFIVTVQLPVKLPNISEPEPDVAIIRGAIRDFSESLPQTAVLIIEISDTTLHYDRTTKASLYAAAGVEDYWIVNLKARQVEVHRTPIEHAKAKFGWTYQDKTEFKAEDSVSPLAASEAKIKVADLLP